ncbi:MAG: nickel transporter [Rubrivivax sp.]
MTPDLPASYAALAALAFALGLRHGLDADHLATIDSLTRLHGNSASRAARWCGALFSLGHGAVVLAVVLALELLQRRWQVPPALQATGAALSLVFLLLLGLANLRAAWLTPAGQIVRPVGFKGRWLGRWLQGRQPLAAAAVGALFALSFDTLSQAALFALAGQGFGPGAATALALLFTAGMLCTDGLNGWWVARLLSSVDARAARASRWMSWAVGAFSLGVAGFGLLHWA